MKQQTSERGQAIIIIVIGFIVILGFVGLAIDAGMVYSDRRHSQNAADASSLAGGGAAALSMENTHLIYSQFDCADPDGRLGQAISAAHEAAISRASSNNFSIDTFTEDQNYVTTACGVDTSSGWADKYLDVTVHISTTTRTNFVQFLFDEGLKSQVHAVTRVRPRIPLALGHAIVALNQNACFGNQNGVIFGGDSQVKVMGGGIFSNGCMSANGASFGAEVTYGSISYAGELDLSAGAGIENFSPQPQPISMIMPEDAVTVEPPNCSAPGAHVVSQINLSGNQTLTLASGLWCVTASKQDAIKVTGGTFTGSGVTIYVPNGGIAITGGDINLEAPAVDSHPDPAIPGVLFYVPNGDVDMEGNNTSRYLGTVYAPNGTIKAHGASGTYPTFNTQLIGLNVDISGNASVDIKFSESTAHQIPTAMDLQQ